MLLFDQITINQITLQFQGTVSFSNLTDYPDIKRDSEFLDKMQQNVNNSNTSKLLTPYLSQIRATYQKARRSVKQRIESKVAE